jgi:ribosome maturation factor RimP
LEGQGTTAQEITDRVRQLAASLLTADGFELVEVEFRREPRGWVLRLYVDKEGGITLDDCTQISREIGRNLDVEDIILSPYHLEVSSPGLTRSLKSEKDFVKYQNRLIKVTTRQAIGNRRQWRGRIQGVEGDQIQIEVDGELLQIPLSNVAKANLEIDPNDRSKPRR